MLLLSLLLLDCRLTRSLLLPPRSTPSPVRTSLLHMVTDFLLPIRTLSPNSRYPPCTTTSASRQPGLSDPALLLRTSHHSVPPVVSDHHVQLDGADSGSTSWPLGLLSARPPIQHVHAFPGTDFHRLDFSPQVLRHSCMSTLLLWPDPRHYLTV